MLNRRLIRIKIFQVLYAHFQSESNGLQASINTLNKSLTGIQNTFNALLSLPFELAHYVETNHNPAEHKYFKKESDARQYDLIRAEKVLLLMRKNPEISKIVEKPSHGWLHDAEFLFILYKKITQQEKMAAFVENEVDSFEVQKGYLVWLYQYLMDDSEDFNQKMEETDMHWADEKYPLNASLKRMIQPIEATLDPLQIEIPELSKDLDDDMSFAKELLKVCIQKEKEFETLIAERTPGWDPERIAKTDMILMYMALAEFMEFPNIPVKATLNEYLELAKMYSTPQSSKFLNGILDKLLKDLTLDHRIVKKGRGLVG